METTFEFCALKYLEIWHTNDKEVFEKINDKNLNKSLRLQALKKAISFYKVARSIPIKEEENAENKGRYYKILEFLDEDCMPKKLVKDNLCESVENVNGKIKNYYRKKDKARNTISATSKILWLKYRSPVRIYDSRARKALINWHNQKENHKVKLNDYNEYVDVWNQYYETKKNDIKDACSDLHSFLQCGRIYNEIKNDTSILSISETDWFKERVFDVYLWNIGG